MTCRELVEFLLEYEDGTLPASERATFDAHLAECPDCVTYVRGYLETIRLGKATGPADDAPLGADVPDELVRAVLAARRRTP